MTDEEVAQLVNQAYRLGVSDTFKFIAAYNLRGILHKVHLESVQTAYEHMQRDADKQLKSAQLCCTRCGTTVNHWRDLALVHQYCPTPDND